MKRFSIHRDGWLDSNIEDFDEARTLARLRLSVGDALITRNLSARGGGDSDAVNVPLLPLVLWLARHWWSLLYEPFRSGAGDAFRARHRLDVAAHGYVFPKIALCSGGAETLLTAWSQSPNEHARIEFLTPASLAPDILARDQAEDELIDLIESVLERLDKKGGAYRTLSDAWARVQASINDNDEAAYCMAAGRLGLDPYDPDAPDLSKFASRIPETMFEDILDALFVEELLQTTDWVKEAQSPLRKAPEVEVADFGVFPKDDLNLLPWEAGSLAAERLRGNTAGEVDNPRYHLVPLHSDYDSLPGSG